MESSSTSWKITPLRRLCGSLADWWVVSLVSASGSSVVERLSEEYRLGGSLYDEGMSPEFVLKLSRSTSSELGRLEEIYNLVTKMHDDL